MKLTNRCCRFCGLALPTDAKANAEFCPERPGRNSLPCRVAWRNVRMSRGADLYDAFMNLRYNRDVASAFKLWKLMCRMGQAWKEEDDAAGRVSYLHPREIVERNVRHRADILARAHQIGR